MHIPECKPWCGDPIDRDRQVAWVFEGSGKDFCSQACADLGRPVSPVEGHPLHMEQAERYAKETAENKK